MHYEPTGRQTGGEQKPPHSVTVRNRQTKQVAYIKTRHQTFKKAQRQTDRQHKLINVDSEADLQGDR